MVPKKQHEIVETMAQLLTDPCALCMREMKSVELFNVKQLQERIEH